MSTAFWHTIAWFQGWRMDFEGWIVRARWNGAPEAFPDGEGFIEEASIAVRSWRQAALLYWKR